MIELIRMLSMRNKMILPVRLSKKKERSPFVSKLMMKEPLVKERGIFKFYYMKQKELRNVC